ncbi:UNVERIFIED_CONTAM: hypothetical protein GTU68_001741 [Idotea baltica]|nr:hypothetical protein [Idotea baltica]
MEIIRDYGFAIKAECGGACACATCHVHVSPDWTDRLHPARDDEEDMLDTVADLRPTSRLSCQLIWDESLDGLALSLPAIARDKATVTELAPESSPKPKRHNDEPLELVS